VVILMGAPGTIFGLERAGLAGSKIGKVSAGEGTRLFGGAETVSATRILMPIEPISSVVRVVSDPRRRRNFGWVFYLQNSHIGTPTEQESRSEAPNGCAQGLPARPARPLSLGLVGRGAYMHFLG